MDRNRRADRYIQSLNPVLFLPFYKYGSEQQKIWDISGNNNHGTIIGSVPAQIPMLGGREFVANGSFETDPNVEWTPNDCTLASVAGGVSGKCLEITRTGAVIQRALQNKTNLVNGKRYKFSGWVKSGTSGNEAFEMQDIRHGEVNITGTSSATWVYYETYFTHTNGVEFQINLAKSSATAGTMLFDQVSIQEVTGYIDGQGWQTDGVNDYFDCGANSSLKNLTDFTILKWINLQNFGGGMFLGNSNYSNSGFHLNRSNNMIGLISFDAVGETSQYCSPIPMHERSFVSLTRTGTSANFMKNLVDWNVGSETVRPPTPSVNSFYVNSGINGDYPYPKVVWGELIIYNYVLSAQEIRNIYELTRHRYGV